jgi:glycosyltransferase involved in cell wall biosynthesis
MRLFDVVGWRRLARLIDQFNPDIVQSNAGDTIKFAALSKVFFRWSAPLVFRNANTVSDFVDSWPKRMFNRFLVGQVQHVVSVSDLCRKDFIDTYAFRPERITTVPIGIEEHGVESGWPSDLAQMVGPGKILVNVSSFVPEKNHIGLLRIFKRILEFHPNLRLILVGDGPLHDEIMRQIRSLGIEGHVIPLGYRDDAIRIIACADALVLPSNIEGLPAVILEAMYCKTPVVAYDVGGISEVVMNGKTGWLVPPGDEEGFLKSTMEILSSNDQKLIVEEAFTLVNQKYTNKKIAEQFETVYLRLRTQMETS